VLKCATNYKKNQIIGIRNQIADLIESDIAILQYRNITSTQLKQPNIFTKVYLVQLNFI